MSETAKKVIEIIAWHAGLETNEIDVNKSFVDHGLDSLDLMEISLQAEDEMSVTIDWSRVNTVQSLIDLVEKGKC